MKSPIFKTSAFGKHVTAEICAQEGTRNKTRAEAQRTRPQVSPGQAWPAHGWHGAVLGANLGETGRTSLCHTDGPETSLQKD